MDPLYGVLGMMALIVVIAVALVSAPRRTHAWEQPRTSPRKPARVLRQDRWRLREGSPVEPGTLARLETRNTQEREWVTRAKEMSTNAARAATADEGTLTDLEAYARAADELTDRKDDAQAIIDAGVKRRFLIVQLAAFSLLDPAEEGLGDSLEKRGHPLLAGLHRAACSLDRYLASAERAELVGVAPVPVLGAPFSLDLFRRGGLVIPPELSPNRALAMAEAEMLWSPEGGEGHMLYVKSAGYRYTYGFRIEDGFRRVLCSLTITKV